MRGKGAIPVGAEMGARITPAYAGKRMVDGEKKTGN